MPIKNVACRWSFGLLYCLEWMIQKENRGRWPAPLTYATKNVEYSDVCGVYCILCVVGKGLSTIVVYSYS